MEVSVDHVYFLKLQRDNSVRPFVKDGNGIREGTKSDFDWKAGDSVAFSPDDGFAVNVVFVKAPGRVELDDATLGNSTISDGNPRIVPPQAKSGAFGFRCTLIRKSDGKRFGWLTTADDDSSGSPDGNVHN